MLNPKYIFKDKEDANNPNIKIVETYEVVRDDESDTKKPKLDPPEAPEWLRRMETDLDARLWDALAPLHACVGAIAAAMGKDDARSLYRWVDNVNTMEARASAVVKGNGSVSDFWQRNRHLGDDILRAALAAYSTKPAPVLQKKKPNILQEKEREREREYDMRAHIDTLPHGPSTHALIGANPNDEIVLHLPNISQEEKDQLKALQGDAAVLLAPKWVWCMLPMSTFQFLLSHTCFGGLEMCASELGRLPPFRHVPKIVLLHDLIASEDVRDVFAEFVAQRFTKASGGNAYPGRIAAGKMQYNISAGFRTRALHTNWRMGAKLWFEHCVYYMSNQNASLVAQTKRVNLEKERNQLLQPANRNDWLTFLTAVRNRNLITNLEFADYQKVAREWDYYVLLPNHVDAIKRWLIQNPREDPLLFKYEEFTAQKFAQPLHLVAGHVEDFLERLLADGHIDATEQNNYTNAWIRTNTFTLTADHRSALARDAPEYLVIYNYVQTHLANAARLLQVERDVAVLKREAQCAPLSHGTLVVVNEN